MQYTEEELKKILENHQHWLKEDCGGWEDMRANLDGANLDEKEKLRFEKTVHRFFSCLCKNQQPQQP